jgi:hypothetical protein
MNGLKDVTLYPLLFRPISQPDWDVYACIAEGAVVLDISIQMEQTFEEIDSFRSGWNPRAEQVGDRRGNGPSPGSAAEGREGRRDLGGRLAPISKAGACPSGRQRQSEESIPTSDLWDEILSVRGMLERALFRRLHCIGTDNDPCGTPSSSG